MAGFAKRISVLSQRLKGNVEQTVRLTALAIDQAVVLETPVDTGRARSNWITSVGAPSEGTQEAYVPGEGGVTGAANAAFAMQQAQRAVRSYKLGQTIYITNNLPYIQRLNEGYSAQAPANFVEEAVQAGQAAARRAARRLFGGRGRQ